MIYFGLLDDFREELVGACDFVMSNPPFNVDLVSPDKVKNDPRLFTQKKRLCRKKVR